MNVIVLGCQGFLSFCFLSQSLWPSIGGGHFKDQLKQPFFWQIVIAYCVVIRLLFSCEILLRVPSTNYCFSSILQSPVQLAENVISCPVSTCCLGLVWSFNERLYLHLAVFFSVKQWKTWLHDPNCEVTKRTIEHNIKQHKNEEFTSNWICANITEMLTVLSHSSNAFL